VPGGGGSGLCGGRLCRGAADNGYRYHTVADGERQYITADALAVGKVCTRSGGLGRVSGKCWPLISSPDFTLALVQVEVSGAGWWR
jgi:hypothetical protein